MRAVVFATDGRIPAFNFVVLRDDKNYAAPYNMTPVVRKEILDKNPEDRRYAERARLPSSINEYDGSGSTPASTSTRKTPKEAGSNSYLKGQRADLMARGRAVAARGRAPALIRWLFRRSFACPRV